MSVEKESTTSVTVRVYDEFKIGDLAKYLIKITGKGTDGKTTALTHAIEVKGVVGVAAKEQLFLERDSIELKPGGFAKIDIKKGKAKDVSVPFGFSAKIDGSTIFIECKDVKEGGYEARIHGYEGDVAILKMTVKK